MWLLKVNCCLPMFMSDDVIQVEDGCMKKTSQTSREMRQETRHLQLTFSEYQDLGDLFKFNKLKVSIG